MSRLNIKVALVFLALMAIIASVTAVQAGTYNREAAANYALKYAYTPNWWEYRTFDADCTNFVSQSLYAGGWTEVKSGSYLDNAWYYDFGYGRGYSNTWAVAHNLYLFMVRYGGRAAYVPISKQPFTGLQRGDVVQADWEKDGRMDHSLFVTGYGRNGDLLVSGHTNNIKDKSLATIMAENPNARFFGWHINDNYYY